MLAYADDITDIDDGKTFQLSLKYDLNSIRGKYGQPYNIKMVLKYYEFLNFGIANNL